MFAETGYRLSEPYTMFKLQTETEWVLDGYSKYEGDGVEFDFYYYDQAIERVRRMNGEFNTEQLKNNLSGLRINATQAL